MKKKFRNPQRIPSTQTKEKDNTEEKAIERKKKPKKMHTSESRSTPYSLIRFEATPAPAEISPSLLEVTVGGGGGDEEDA